MVVLLPFRKANVNRAVIAQDCKGRLPTFAILLRFLSLTSFQVMRKNQFFAIILTFIIVAGCGGNLIPTGGKVTYEDGTPVPVGGIVFETGNFMADGRIQPDGTYTLSSLKPGDGLPAGTYNVTISGTEYDEKDRRIEHVHPKFSNPATSELTAEVTKGQSQFNFTVTKP